MEHSLTLSFSICVIEDAIYSFSYSLRATKVLASFVHIVITNTAEKQIFPEKSWINIQKIYGTKIIQKIYIC